MDARGATASTKNAMNRPIWIDERPRRLGWLLGLLALLSALLLALATQHWRDAPVASTRTAGVDRSPAPAPTTPMLETVRAADTTRPAARRAEASVALHCPYQRLDITDADGRSAGACVTTTQAAQSGDLRSYHVDAQGTSTWRLRLDTGLGRVMAAELSAPGLDYRCEGDDCRGFVIGARDAHGSRKLTIRDATLVAADGARRVNLSADLQVQGEQQDPTTACSGPSVTVVEARGGVLVLCPSGGAGVARLDDERRVYSLRGPAGDTLQVGLARDGSVDYVEIGGLACRGTACSGATTRPGETPDVEAGRQFVFSGTTLSDGRGATAMLSGNAVLPAF